MKIAVEGCCHGELDATYDHIATLERTNGYTIELLLICGDFQAIRNSRDLQCMSVPDKYKQLGTFHKYYTGEKLAPVLTIVIGGNHEASNYMWELYHGGWLAPNIYFLGHAGCVQVDGIRIAGASGIFGGHDFRQGHWERVPYDRSSMRSIYHIREFNIRRLSLLSPRSHTHVNIFLSHDWPQNIAHYGDLPSLLRRKAFFRADIESGKLGSPPLWGLMGAIRPEWWFAAHLHVRFEALVRHEEGNGEKEVQDVKVVKAENPDEILIDEDEDFDGEGGVVMATEEYTPAPHANAEEIILNGEEDVAPPSPPAKAEGPLETKFLALDKCLPRRQFLEVVDIPSRTTALISTPHKPRFTYDPEWLAVTRAFHPYLSTSRHQPTYPDEAEAREMVKEAGEWVRANVSNTNAERKEGEGDGVKEVEDCQSFVMTAPGPGPGPGGDRNSQPPWYTNPQTEAFCKMIGVINKINPPPSDFQSGS